MSSCEKVAENAVGQSKMFPRMTRIDAVVLLDIDEDAEIASDDEDDDETGMAA